jgi:hypothetical protein
MIENFKLHVFRVVADTLNFSKAAEELHISHVRVAFCVVGFARQNDRLYVLISMSVFAILIYGLQGGR